MKDKALTIPRLELQAALIASRLKVTIVQEIKINIHHVYLWSDSKTVLNYIKNQSTDFGTYVLHRTNEIRNNTAIESWKYIPSRYNVADDATRGIEFKNLSNNHRWFIGPRFLHIIDPNYNQLFIKSENTFSKKENDKPHQFNNPNKLYMYR